MRREPPRVPRSLGLRVGLLVLLALVLVLPAWALYLAIVLPQEHVTTDWDLVWAGFDFGLALLAAAGVVALRQRSDWAPVLAGALAAALVCDAWFDVTTSHGRARLLAIVLALAAELPVAAVAALVGRRSVQAIGSTPPRQPR